MGIRQLRTNKDEILRKKCRKVEEVNDRILILLDDMVETMYEADGVGLAAPQVGILKRIAVIDVGDGPICLINPEILEVEGEAIDEEGCLSLPGRTGNVKRPAKATVKALNEKGEEYTITGEGLLARALCHEIDHLDGILFIDKVIESEE